MVDPKQIISQLEQLDSTLRQAIEKILGKNPTQQQMLIFLTQGEFDKLVDDLGLRQIVTQYISGFDTIFNQRISGFQQVDMTAERIQIIKNNVDLVKNSNGRTVLGYAKANSELLKTKLINSIINGVDERQTIKELESLPIATHQIGAVINTSYADASRMSTRLAFINSPNQRFKYVGGEIPTSSEQCAWLFENQKIEGYTMAEIDKGIISPFIWTSGPFAGQNKIIDWFGRLPNYNCIHEFLPI